MKAKITLESGWIVRYGGKRLKIPQNSVLNGDLAAQAISEKAAIRASDSAKATPISSYAAVEKQKKDLGAAPENKKSDG